MTTEDTRQQAFLTRAAVMVAQANLERDRLQELIVKATTVLAHLKYDQERKVFTIAEIDLKRLGYRVVDGEIKE